MATKNLLEAQNPLILRCNRLMEAFAKSDDERDFYFDKQEGFLIYADLDKPEEDLQVLEEELKKNAQRYSLIPKLTFYETKKIMEGFVNEKVYDIDTKEKLLEIIQSKEARENFLDFIYDHHSELEKWQAFYQERSRIRIIEWLRINHLQFVFEEDLDLPKNLIEKLKQELFQAKAGKEVLNARKILSTKAKTYYSSEALNPRPKRGRPPKQALKAEVEHQVSTDIYTTVPNGLLGFLFIPDLTNPSSATFSSKFGTEGDLFTHRRPASEADLSLDTLNMKLKELRSLSSKWKADDDEAFSKMKSNKKDVKSFDDDDDDDFDDFEDEDEDDFDDFVSKKRKPSGNKKIAPQKAAAPIKKGAKKPAAVTPAKKSAAPAAKAKSPSKPPLRKLAKTPVKVPVKPPAKASKPAKPIKPVQASKPSKAKPVIKEKPGKKALRRLTTKPPKK
jgi:hypothetical protein